MDLGPVLSEPPDITSRLDVEGKKFWPRAFAYIIDYIVVNLTSFAAGFISVFAFRFILYLIVVAIGYSYRTVLPESNNLFMNFALGFLISLTYFIAFETLTGATPGKLILKMRVATLDGDRPSLKAVTIRAFWRLIDGLFFGLVAAASMTVPLQQRHGDKRAMTIVVGSNSSILRYKPSVLHFILAALIYSLSSSVIQVFETLAYTTFTPLP
jgi:uncharacterized RDD family membrane protein YckC